jgi:hypothetical protein
MQAEALPLDIHLLILEEEQARNLDTAGLMMECIDNTEITALTTEYVFLRKLIIILPSIIILLSYHR